MTGGWNAPPFGELVAVDVGEIVNSVSGVSICLLAWTVSELRCWAGDMAV